MHPVLFTIGSFTVGTYGVLLAAAFGTVTVLGYRRAKKSAGVPPERVLDLAVYVLLSGLAGARVYYVLDNFGDFRMAPLAVLFAREGFVFYGGLVSAIACAVIVLRVWKLPFFKVADIIMLYLPVGHAMGRLGCFMYGCCYGRVTQGWTGVLFPGFSHPRHPTQLYEAAAMAGIFLVLNIVARMNQGEGSITLTYLILYPVARFIVEFYRGDSPETVYGFTLPQVISAAIFLCAVFILWTLKRKSPA